MISPLMRILHDGATARDVRRWLAKELNDHFGLTPDRTER